MRFLIPAALAAFVALGPFALVYAADADSDGFSDTIEAHSRHDPNDPCGPGGPAPGGGTYAGGWPADYTDDTFVDISDVIHWTANFGQGTVGQLPLDIAPEPAGDNFIDISDLVRVTALFDTSCTP